MEPATWAGISAIGSIITAGIAAFSLLGARKDSHDRTRPVVVAYLRTGPRYGKTTYLTIENAGASAARNVRVRFNPTLPTAERADDGTNNAVGPFITRRYARPLAVLASGQKLNNVYKPGPNAQEAKVPTKVTVSVSYEDDRGRSYRESFALDVAMIDVETYGTPGDKNNAEIRRSKAVEAVAWELWE